jgi:uncharacterized protein (TIGR00251 family)
VAKPPASRRFWGLVDWVVSRPATPCHLLPRILTSLFTSLFTSPPKANSYGDDRAKGLEPPRATGTMGRLNVKVVPGSSRDQIVGWLGDALKIKVMAPPEKGRANEAVVELLSMKLGISTDDIEVVSGHSSPSKVIAIEGMDDEAIKKALG